MTERPDFDRLFRSVARSAVHLEMRDDYGAGSPAFAAWRERRPYDRREPDAAWRALVGSVVGRGATVRRARVVSEPASDYIRFEYEVTPAATRGTHVPHGRRAGRARGLRTRRLRAMIGRIGPVTAVQAANDAYHTARPPPLLLLRIRFPIWSSMPRSRRQGDRAKSRNNPEAGLHAIGDLATPRS
jgi:hypothetical protein